MTGRDEVARLGHAFNAMASSIEENERQRKAMVSDIAHELRTPLANVRGYLEAAEDGVVPMDPELVTSLLEEAALLQRLIDDLQDLALADAGMLRIHREETDAAELARQVTAAHRATASAAGSTLTVDAPSSVMIDVDPARLRQALGNLVANAVQYAGPGGHVQVLVARSGSEVLLQVVDDGPGIDPEHLEHLFDRFYRTDTSRTRATGGSGLGLAITKHLVEAHAGTVAVESTVGTGSTFTIRLPLTPRCPPDLGSRGQTAPLCRIEATSGSRCATIGPRLRSKPARRPRGSHGGTVDTAWAAELVEETVGGGTDDAARPGAPARGQRVRVR